MVKITDGNSTKTVTMGMYNDIYRQMGFRIAGSNNEKKVIEPKKVEKEIVVKDAPFKERPNTNSKHK